MNDPYLRGRPLRLHWAGWETDTFRLQQAGWQISAEQDVYRNSMGFALRAPSGEAYGMTQRLPFDFHQSFDFRAGPLDIGANVMLARDIHINQMGTPDWRAIDAIPQIVERRITRIEDLAHFAAPLARTQEFVVPEESVDELLQRILKMQQPDRTARIRDRLRHPEGWQMDALPQTKFHAQILSFPSAA